MATATAPATVTPLTPEIDLDGLLRRVERQPAITIDADAPRVKFGSSAIVTTGVRPFGKSTEDVLAIVDGSTRTGFPQAAILNAIVGGVIPRSLVEACLRKQDSLRA